MNANPELEKEASEELCSHCQSRPARNHVCFGGQGKSVDLCDECLKITEPQIAKMIKGMPDARCRFCGGGPCSGTTDTLAQILDAYSGKEMPFPPEMIFTCLSCQMEHSGFITRELERMPRDLDEAAQREFLSRIESAAELHLQQFVRDRDGS